MLGRLGLYLPLQILFDLFISFAFFVGVFLMASPEVFTSLDRVFRKQYGFKRKLIPQLEDKEIDVVDRFITKNRVAFGMGISIIAFLVLIIYR